MLAPADLEAGGKHDTGALFPRDCIVALWGFFGADFAAFPPLLIIFPGSNSAHDRLLYLPQNKCSSGFVVFQNGYQSRSGYESQAVQTEAEEQWWRKRKESQLRGERMDELDATVHEFQRKNSSKTS